MNDKNTSIERFFRELSRRMYKENDLSDMVYALCRSNSDFMQFFLNFIFGVGKLNATDFRIEREVSFGNDRPDFVLTKKDSGKRYFIEVKIGDRSQHFKQYSTQLAKLNTNSNLDFNVINDVADITKYLGYITNYEIQEGELSSDDKTAFNGCKGNGTYHTWSEFKDALYKSKLVGDLNEDIRGLLAYCEMVCPSQQEDEQIAEYTHDPDNFREIKDCYFALEYYLSKGDKIKEVLGHEIKIKKYRVANTPAESIGIYFEAQDESTGINEKDKMCEGKKIWGWAGWLLTEGFHPGFCIAFDNNNGWGAPVFESLNKQDESWMPFCNGFEKASDGFFQEAFKEVFKQIIGGKKDDCKHDKEVNTSLYAARALPLYLKQQVFPNLSCQGYIIEPFQQKDSFNPKGWCGEYFAVKTNPKDGEEGRQVGVYWVGTYFNQEENCGELFCEKIGVAINVLKRDQSLADQINEILKKNIENSACSVGEN